MTTTFNNEDAVKWRREGEGGRECCFSSSPTKASWDLWDSKRATNWGTWISWENFSVFACLNSSIKEAPQRPLWELRWNPTHVWGLHIWQGYLILHWCLQSLFMQNTQKKEKRRSQIFIGFSGTKVTCLSPQWHHTPGVDEVYHGNDNQPDNSTTILECLVSLISTVHSSIGNLTLSLNVFLFLLFLFWCLQNALCKRGHENAHTTMSKKLKKRSPYQILFHHLWDATSH